MTFKIWGTEDLTRTVANQTVELPAITALANGGYVAMWREATDKLLYQIYDGNGVKTTAQPLQLQSGSAHAPTFAQVTAIGTEGNFAVTWSEINGTNVSLFNRVYDASGNAVSETTTLANGTGKSGAQVTMADSGGWAAAYIDGSNVELTVFTSSGATAGSVPVFTAGSSTNLDVAWLGPNKYIVAYQTSNGVFASIVSEAVGTAFSLETSGPIDIIGLKDPTTGNPSGEFVVIKDLGASSIVAQRYSATGQKINGQVAIGGAKPNSDFDSVTAVALKSGGYALAYIQADSTTGDFGDVYVKVVDASGTAGPALKINARTNLDGPGSQRAPSISEMADGRLSITWWDPTSSAGNGSNISSTIVDARVDKIKVTGTSKSDVYAPSEYAKDTLDGSGGFDTLTFKGTTTGGVAVNLVEGKGTAGDANEDTYTNFEKVIGSNFNDTLEGGAGHVFVGGAGNDTYIVHASDTVIDESGGGFDQVYSTVAYTLSANIENLFASGGNAIDLTGNGSSNLIIGNDAANRLTGHGGDDALYGNGGNGGNDVLDGGDGNDGLNGGDGDDVLNGGNGNDALDGGIGNDALDGGIGNDNLAGGSGLDNLQGGAGNDTLDGGGENDVLNGGEGVDNLSGGDGDDTLNGKGGADMMNGGAGNDTYYIDDANDQIIDGAGMDTVVISTTYDISRLTTIENFTGIGAASITLTGNLFNNTLNGNDGANILIGGAGNDILNGGAGKDRLHGGLGADKLNGGTQADIFVFDTNWKTKGNADRIVNYAKEDSIYLEDKYFKVGPKGSITKPKKMAAKHFYAGTKAHEADDRIIYNKNKGALYYDPDGNGAKKAVLFATIENKPKIDYHEFFVI